MGRVGSVGLRVLGVLGITVAFGVGVAGCANLVLDPVAAGGAVLEVQYSNYAWVPTLKGFVIDSTGDVYSYDLGGKSWNPADPARPTNVELATKYQTSRKRVKELSLEQTTDLFALVNGAAGGSVTTPVSRCADAGSLTYTVYRPVDANRNERILLRAEGDLIQENRATAARDLATKLAALALLPPINGCQP